MDATNIEDFEDTGFLYAYVVRHVLGAVIVFVLLTAHIKTYFKNKSDVCMGISISFSNLSLLNPRPTPKELLHCLQIPRME